jgi:hypothetical protein
MIRITEAARELGVCADRLKRLEAAGLFVARRDIAGQRRYAREDIARLHAILYPAASAASAHVGTTPTGGNEADGTGNVPAQLSGQG